MCSDRQGRPAGDLERQLHHFGLTLEALADEPLRPEPDSGPIPVVEIELGPGHQERGPSNRSRRLLAVAVVLAVALIGAVLARQLRDEPSGPAGLGVDTGQVEQEEESAPPFDRPSTLTDGTGETLATVSADDDGVLAVDFTGDDPSDNLFVALAVEQLLEDDTILPGADVHERRDLLTGAGLEITLTLDPAAQQVAADLVGRELTDEAVAGGAGAQVAAIDNRTGAVRALYVRYDWSEAAVDRWFPPSGSVQGRDDAGQFPGLTRGEELRLGLGHRDHRTGSRVFAPILQAAALEAGLNPADRVFGESPCSFNTPGQAVDPYEVGRAEENDSVSVSIAAISTDATNCALVRLGLIVGLDNVLATANRLGLGKPSDEQSPELSLPLSGVAADPVQVPAAYATLANGGQLVSPRYVERVRGPQGALFQNGSPTDDDAAPVIAPETAITVIGWLRSSRRTMLYDHPVAGVTSANQLGAEGWTVGLSSHLTTAVWVGDLQHRDQEPSGDPAIAGNALEGVTTRIWEELMTALHTRLAPEPLPEPAPVDAASGVDLTTPPGVEEEP